MIYLTRSGAVLRFDRSKSACFSVFGVASGHTVLCPNGKMALVIGNHGGLLWMHVEGEYGASYWSGVIDEASFLSAGFSLSMNPLDCIGYKTKSGLKRQLKISPFDCRPFGFLWGDVVEKVGSRAGTVIGVDNNNLFFHFNGDKGISFMNRYTASMFIEEGYQRIMDPDDGLFSSVDEESRCRAVAEFPDDDNVIPCFSPFEQGIPSSSLSFIEIASFKEEISGTDRHPEEMSSSAIDSVEEQELVEESVGGGMHAVVDAPRDPNPDETIPSWILEMVAPSGLTADVILDKSKELESMEAAIDWALMYAEYMNNSGGAPYKIEGDDTDSIDSDDSGPNQIPDWIADRLTNLGLCRRDFLDVYERYDGDLQRTCDYFLSLSLASPAPGKTFTFPSVPVPGILEQEPELLDPVEPTNQDSEELDPRYRSILMDMVDIVRRAFAHLVQVAKFEVEGRSQMNWYDIILQRAWLRDPGSRPYTIDPDQLELLKTWRFDKFSIKLSSILLTGCFELESNSPQSTSVEWIYALEDPRQRGAVRNLEALCSMIVNKEEDYSKEQFNRIATDIVNVMTSFRSSDDLNAQPGEITVPHLLMTSLAALEQGKEIPEGSHSVDSLWSLKSGTSDRTMSIDSTSVFSHTPIEFESELRTVYMFLCGLEKCMSYAISSAIQGTKIRRRGHSFEKSFRTGEHTITLDSGEDVKLKIIDCGQWTNIESADETQHRTQLLEQELKSATGPKFIVISFSLDKLRRLQDLKQGVNRGYVYDIVRLFSQSSSTVVESGRSRSGSVPLSSAGVPLFFFGVYEDDNDQTRDQRVVQASSKFAASFHAEFFEIPLMIVNEPEDVTVMSFTLDDVILSAVQKAIEMDDANRPETRVGPSRTLVDRTSDHFSFVEVDSPLPSSSPSGSSTSSSQSGLMNMNSIEERRSSYEQGFSAQRVDAELLSPDFSSKRPFDSSPDLARHLDQSLSLSSDSFYSEPRHVEPKSSRFTGSLAMSSSQSIVSQKKFNISKSQVSIGALRGSGGFGRVYQGKLYGTDVAVKEIVVQEDDIMKIQQELYSLDAARHPNVVTLMGAVVEEFPKVYIITEWVDGGDLHDWIYKGRGRHASIGEILNLLHKIAGTMAFLHSINIVHRDLKPRNVLLTRHMDPKICDFGLSRINSDSKARKSMHTFGGTLQYMAAEILKGEAYDEKADVYSFGVMMNEMFARETPFSDATNQFNIMYKVASERKRPDIVEDTPERVKDLIRRCWDGDSIENNRPSFVDVVEELGEILRNCEEDEVLKRNLDGEK